MLAVDQVWINSRKSLGGGGGGHFTKYISMGGEWWGDDESIGPIGYKVL